MSSLRSRRGGTGLKILAVLLVVIVGVGGLIGYSYTQITTNIRDVEYSGLKFSEPNASTLIGLTVNVVTQRYISAALSLLDSLVLQANVDVANHGFLPVIIPSLDYDVSINGIPAVSGSSSDSYTLSPGDMENVPIRVEIPIKDLDSVIGSIIETLGELDVEITGTFNANFLGIPIELPFKTEQRISLGQVAKEKAEAWVSRMSGGNGDTPKDFSIESMKWMVNGKEVTSADPDSIVTAVAVIKAEKRFGYDVSLEVRQDRKGLQDKSFNTETYQLVMQPGDTEELSVTFRADGGITVSGYFMSIRWDGANQWQMSNFYPPRLRVEESSSSSIIVPDAFWTLDDLPVVSVEDGELVVANVWISADGNFDGTVTVAVRQDRSLAADVSVADRSFNVDLTSGQDQHLTVSFTAQSGENGYFVKVSWSGGSWDMPNSYPPRLRVEEPALSAAPGNLQVLEAFWMVDNIRVDEVSGDTMVDAHLIIKAVGGSFTGEVLLEIRQDNIGSPDQTIREDSIIISLDEGQTIELTLTFISESHWYSQGYFIRVFWAAGSWEMPNDYPPRLSV